MEAKRDDLDKTKARETSSLEGEVVEGAKGSKEELQSKDDKVEDSDESGVDEQGRLTRRRHRRLDLTCGRR